MEQNSTASRENGRVHFALEYRGGWRVASGVKIWAFK
jgi:hypothetical protein